MQASGESPGRVPDEQIASNDAPRCVMDPNEPVAVYTVSNPVEAEIIKNALRSEGIACELEGVNQAAEAGLIGLEIKILVPAHDANAARNFLTEHERQRKSAEE